MHFSKRACQRLQSILSAVSCFLACSIAWSDQPNILLVVADDAGYADFGFHGSEVMKTPQLDDFAKQCMRFEQAYVTAAVCGPSRAGILTGKYQQRFGFEENNVPGYMSPSRLPDDEMGLPLDQKVIPQYLQELGYRTALFGKWHQGNADRFHPTKRGFDEFYGFRGGARSYFPFGKHNPVNRPENKLERGFGQFEEAQTYLTDALAGETNAFMERNRDRAFFVMVSFNAVHTPMQAGQDDLAEFPDLTGKRKQLAAMTRSLDRACGSMFQKLAELGLDQNTIVIFTNDNGGPSDSNASVNYPLSGTKANHLEGGIRVPFLLRWPGVVADRSVYQHPISTLDLLPTFVNAGGGDASSIDGLDGVDLRPWITNQKKNRPHQTLFWKKENRAAIREGDWKLLRFPDRPAELYDLRTDIAETQDLANKHPQTVRQLYKKLFAWELTLQRSAWQLRREYEGATMKRMDAYRTQPHPSGIRPNE